MNLWFRLIWMLLTVRLRKRASLFDTCVLRMRVWPNDLDFNMHVNNGRYFTLADIGRMDFVLRTGAARVALRQGARPIVGDAMARFRKELKVFETYELHTRLLGWDSKWVFMEHRFVRGGRVAGVVVMRGLFRARQGPIAPAALLEAMALAAEPPPLPEWLRAWSDSCDALAASIQDEERPAMPLNRASG